MAHIMSVSCRDNLRRNNFAVCRIYEFALTNRKKTKKVCALESEREKEGKRPTRVIQNAMCARSFVFIAMNEKRGARGSLLSSRREHA